MGGQGQFMNPQTGIPNGLDLSSLFSGAGRMNAGGFGSQGGPLGGVASASMPSFAMPEAPGGGRLPIDSMTRAYGGPGATMSNVLSGGGSPPFFPGGGGSPPFNPGTDPRSMFTWSSGGGSPPFNPNGGSPPFFPGGGREMPAPMPLPRRGGEMPAPGGAPGRGGSPPFNPNPLPIDSGGVGIPSGPGPRPAAPRPWTGPQTSVPEMSFTPAMNWQTYRGLSPQQQQHPAWRSFVGSQPAPGRGSAY